MNEGMTARKKVIIDSDIGWDDVLSLLYLMKRPDIEIVGVTVTGCGETNLRWGTIIAKTLMELGNQTQARVCVGAEKPLEYNHVFPQSFKDDMNDIMGLLGTLNPETEIELDPRPASEFLGETINNSDEPITLLALGGFTNIALMLQQYPDLKIENITQLYTMAGAVWVDGNVAALNNAQPGWNQGPIYSTNNVAEWNVFVDPVAAKYVFDSKIPLTLVPLDACNYVVLNEGYADQITATDPIAQLAHNIFYKKTHDHDEGIPVPIFDPLATMVAAGQLKNYQSHDVYLDVNVIDTEENNQCGNTFVTDSGSRKITVVQGVSQLEFATNYADTLNSPINLD